jgi:GTP1/Obg family GTP-binding protein
LYDDVNIIIQGFFMDYPTVKFWFDVGQTLLIAAVALQQYFNKRQSATISSINRVEDSANAKISNLEHRITRFEEFVKHVPTHQDLGEIHEKINEVNSSLKELTGGVKHLTSSLDRLYQNELSKNNKG